MILINSAAYVNTEFRNEFGAIPPCFLPIGNQKLITYQVKALKKMLDSSERIFVSLPQKYELNINEHILIKNLGVEPIFVPENISLGMAVLYVLNTIEYLNNDVLRLLHGDTFLDDIPNSIECIALSSVQDEYEWEFDKKSNNKLLWCGYFAFGSLRGFIKELAISQGDFIQAVHSYVEKRSSMNYPQVFKWYDLGHINTYFRSRSVITTQRAFNALRIKDGIVWKSGTPSRKIEAEANWLLNLPPTLKRFIPQLIQSGVTDCGQTFYETEYLSYLPLNEIFVHGKNNTIFWDSILGLIVFYMSESSKCFPIDNQNLLEEIQMDSLALYQDKTYERLESYASQKGIDLDQITIYEGIELPSIRQIARECIEKTLMLPIIPAVVHGDLCFSNIMYDSRSHSIKVIDPRGLNTRQEFTIYGNQTYDLAKLCHSIIGLYDFIIADAFVLEKSPELGVKIIFSIDKRLAQVQDLFMNKQLLPNIDNQDIIAATILLFLSMIPLHFDKPDRQEAMLANALRLYVMISR